MSEGVKTRDIEIEGGAVVRLSKDKLLVYEAFEVCLRRQEDATADEIYTVLGVQLSEVVQHNRFSGRFSDLCDLGVLEKCDIKRHDASTERKQAKKPGKVVPPVTAWRFPVLQRRLIG